MRRVEAPEVNALATMLRGCRHPDTLIFEVVERPEDEPLTSSGEAALLDAFVSSLGLHPTGERWREIDQAETQSTLEFMLGHDLAYGLPTSPPGVAGAAVEKLMTSFAGARAYVAHANITDATFEEGVVFLCPDRLAIAWVMDED
jgi:hypothetical protein